MSFKTIIFRGGFKTQLDFELGFEPTATAEVRTGLSGAGTLFRAARTVQAERILSGVPLAIIT